MFVCESEGCLALPKLNLQFLTLHDYLLRNFNLFRLESTYEIRQDIEDVVLRMKPWFVPFLHPEATTWNTLIEVCHLFVLFQVQEAKTLSTQANF